MMLDVETQRARFPSTNENLIMSAILASLSAVQCSTRGEAKRAYSSRSLGDIVTIVAIGIATSVSKTWL
jgi:hypothetical protein